MGHTNSTTNYNLPQFITTDKPAWLTDVNNAYTAIDTGIHAAKTTADGAQSDATQALSDAAAASNIASAAGTKADGVIASLADEFLTTSTYETGDIVVYNSLLYICTSDVTTPGAWTGSTNWLRTTVESLYVDLKNILATKADASDLPVASDLSFGMNPALRGSITVTRYGKVIWIRGSIIADNGDIATTTNLLWSLPHPRSGAFYPYLNAYDKATGCILGADGTLKPSDYAFRRGIWFGVNITYISE